MTSVCLLSTVGCHKDDHFLEEDLDAHKFSIYTFLDVGYNAIRKEKA